MHRKGEKKMLDNFYTDLEKAKKAEQIVKDTFAALTKKYTFEDVSNNREYFYKGDIKATSSTGKEIFIEVKDDSRIAESKNVLCEYEVYYKESNYYGKGNMKANYDIYCVVSQSERKIYVIDFSILKQIYKKGEHKVIDHYNQTTYCYLLSLGTIKKYGGLIDTIEF